MREIKFQILIEISNKDFTKKIVEHYTSLDRLMNGDDSMDYSKVDIIAKRQFTGLTDRNGVDIYKGDLIKNQRGRTAEVVWHKFTASFDSVFISDDGSAPIGQDKSYGFHNADWKHEIEVIGNIYQNQELIENNNK